MYTLKSLSLTCFLIAGILSKLYSQRNVNVDLSTGTAYVSFPLATIQKGDITVPITLSYAGRGVKVEDYNMSVGLGWTLSTDWGVYRQVKDFPDDTIYNNGYNTINGWIKSNTTPNSVSGFTIANTDNGICSEEIQDRTYINGIQIDDLEPDVFYVSAPGVACSFVFDANKQIRLLEYKDYQISYTLSSGGALASFTIMSDNGVEYKFEERVYVSYKLNDLDNAKSLSEIDAFKREFTLYRRSSPSTITPVKFVTRWALTQISDSKNNRVYFNYRDRLQSSDKDEKREILKFNGNTFETKTLFRYIKDINYRTLSSISTSTDDIAEMVAELRWFNFNGDLSIGGVDLFKENTRYTFNYTKKYKKTTTDEFSGRFFLRQISAIKAASCQASWNVDLEYYGVVYNPNTLTGSAFCEDFDKTTTMMDYWGYYNGASNTSLAPPVWVYPNDNSIGNKFRITPMPSTYNGQGVLLPGESPQSLPKYRNPDIDYTILGSLQRIRFSNGAVTELEYESNKFWDPDAQQEISGSGLRIKKIVENDGLNTNEITNYSYTDGNSITTGRAISLPSFALFTNSSNGSTLDEKVKWSVYRSMEDLNEESKDVVYGLVTVSKGVNGHLNGHSSYEFSTAGTWGGEASSWAASPVHILRTDISGSGTCPSFEPSFLSGGQNVFPFPANPNFNYERGSLKSVINYNNNGDKVSQDFYSYVPVTISGNDVWGLKYDEAGNIRSYSKYKLHSNSGKLLSQKTSTTFDLAGSGSGHDITTTEDYEYNSTSHQNPTRVLTTNGNGDVYSQKFYYVKDYAGASNNGDDFTKAIYKLQARNINSLVESVKFRNTSSSGEQAISGSLILFKEFDFPDFPAIYAPAEMWSFSTPAGLSSFTTSSIQGGSFVKDNAYEMSSNILSYSPIGVASSMSDRSRIIKSVLINGYFYPAQKMAEFENAAPKEIVYTPFEMFSGRELQTQQISHLVEPGRYSDKAYLLTSDAALATEVINAKTNTDMVFSIWVKDATDGTLTVTLNNIDYQISIQASTGWRYYEKHIPRPSVLAGASYNFVISTNHPIIIDDVMLYPGNASFKAYAYTTILKENFSTYHQKWENFCQRVLTSETTLNGVSNYYEYYKNGQVSFIRDQFENIREFRRYKRAQKWGEHDVDPYSLPQINSTSPSFTNVPVFFINKEYDHIVCSDYGFACKWDFGDGTIQTVPNSLMATHVYNSPGTYTVKSTIVPIGYDDIILSPITVTVTEQSVGGLPAITPQICADGVEDYSIANGSPQYAITDCETEPDPGGNEQQTFFVLNLPVAGSLPGGTVAYKLWEWAPLNSYEWTLMGNDDELKIVFNPSSTKSYKVRCTVVLTDGRVGVSNVLEVINHTLQ